MITPKNSAFNINLACVGVATVNVIVSVAAWMLSGRNGRKSNVDFQRGDASDMLLNDMDRAVTDNFGSPLGMATVIIALIILVLTALYAYKSSKEAGGGGGGSINVEEIQGTVNSLNLPNLPTGVTDVHIKRTYQTEDIFLENKGVPKGPSGDATPFVDPYQPEVSFQPEIVTSSPTDYGQYRTIERTHPGYGATTETMSETDRFHQITIQQDNNFQPNMQLLPIQDVTSQPSIIGSGQGEPISVPIRVSQPGMEDELVTNVDDLKVDLLLRGQPTEMGSTTTMMTQKTETRYETIQQSQVIQTGAPQSVISSEPTMQPLPIMQEPTMQALPIMQEPYDTTMSSVQQPPPPTFEPGADVYFKLEEARYQYVPDIVAPAPDIIVPGEGAYQSFVPQQAPSITDTQASIKQLPIQVMDDINSCSKICSQCKRLTGFTGSFQGVGGSFTGTGSFQGAAGGGAGAGGGFDGSIIGNIFTVLLIIALCTIPVFLLSKFKIFAELRGILLELPSDLYRSVLHWIDDLDECPSAVGFAFGVIFISVILGSSYYYNHKDIVSRRSTLANAGMTGVTARTIG